ncbi:hypothetical protein [Paraburkholderia silvatlantica]|uniref:hypothetical protein n=1 Tax=Paraburkholderia silvatlantica TaxID=321895 RepID=UPI0011B38254|nr:hypothetical protein [Paraburkholderia silvatlantica]
MDYARPNATFLAHLGRNPEVEHQAAGAVRRLIEPGFRSQPGDPAKMAQAMSASVYQHPTPKRLAFGTDAYNNIKAALTERLATLAAQKDIAVSTDFSGLSR